ncbi:GlsB/YeaQ/YmgE family stress response membrane protein [Paludibaculum fermentans]|uniref:GlsB/YeaQ/YmgE family stress response membrane protein n=1 Tax=Paludibaculum fermentans TaxID=1473598 RepID=UPI003EB7FD40
MLSFIWMCLIGLVAGALAKLIMPGKDPGGMLITMLLGIAGSVVAGFLGRSLGWYHEGEGAGLIMSVVGAILLLWVYRMMRKGPAAG